MTKREFLKNKINKQRFVNMLCEALEKRSCRSCYASTDADLLIVQKAIESAANTDTILVGDDTDLLVILCYHASLDSCSLYFQPVARRKTKYRRIWHAQSVKKQLGPQVCDHILFLHAILGCDTTSRLHDIGKGNALKKFREGGRFCEVAKVFNLSSASKQDIAEKL